MEFRVPIVVGYAMRIGDGFKYRMAVQDIIHPEDWDTQDAPPSRYITQAATPEASKNLSAKTQANTYGPIQPLVLLPQRRSFRSLLINSSRRVLAVTHPVSVADTAPAHSPTQIAAPPPLLPRKRSTRRAIS